MPRMAMATGREIRELFWSRRYYVWNTPERLQKNMVMRNEFEYLKDQGAHHVDSGGPSWPGAS